MEALWSDLTQNPEDFESPEWHFEELDKTEQLIAEGKEYFMDWEESKLLVRES